MRASSMLTCVGAAHDHHHSRIAPTNTNTTRAAPCPSSLIPSRREIISGIAFVPIGLALSPTLPSLAGELPPAAALGDCQDCVGEVNNTLNTCPVESQSCISTLNDDELHFEAPWQYDGSTAEAIDELVALASGGDYEPPLIDTPFGVSRGDAAGYIAKGVLAVLQNGDMPEQPKRRRQAVAARFDGVVADRHTTKNSGEYVRLTLGGTSNSGSPDPVEVIDAEFLFLPNDSIVNVRAVSRGQPEGNSGKLALSFTQGLVVDRNVARRRMDALRTALRWELAAVLTDFSPQFNPAAPEFVEKIFKPFDSRSNFRPSGMSYPVDE